MITSSFKRGMSLLIGLFLVLSLICVSAIGQGKGKRGKARGRGIVAETSGGFPTLTTPYFCVYTINGSGPRQATVTMTYSPNPIHGGFLGQIHNVYPDNSVLDAAMQVYNPRLQAGGTLWSYQRQDGAVVCKEMFVTVDKRIVKFSQCSNGAVQTCYSY